jgi:hypothetical protein
MADTSAEQGDCTSACDRIAILEDLIAFHVEQNARAVVMLGVALRSIPATQSSLHESLAATRKAHDLVKEVAVGLAEANALTYKTLCNLGDGPGSARWVH